MEDISHSHLFYFHAFSLLLSLLGFFNSHLHMNTNTFLWISSPLTHTHIAHSFPLPHLFLFSSSATCSLLHLLIHTHAYTHILFLSLSFFLSLSHSLLSSLLFSHIHTCAVVLSTSRLLLPSRCSTNTHWRTCGMMWLMWWCDEWYDEIDVMMNGVIDEWWMMRWDWWCVMMCGDVVWLMW